MSEVTTQAQQLADSLCKILGDKAVKTDLESRVLYAQDVYAKDIPAAIVIKPTDRHQLAAAVAEATAKGFSVLPRGGGMSYTKGYVPVEENSVIVDMSELNQVLEINTEDMYVTVECGCSWEKLHQSLKGSGYRTPFWGTLSGRFATVGGGLSQNAIFWGSGQYGFAADSVLSLDVILASGEVITTGSAAQHKSSPFCRHFGPDLTGLFCCDSSSFGVKTTATLRLVPESKEKDGLSFTFKEFHQQAQFMMAVSRQSLASECFGFDPFLQAQRMQRESLAKDVKALFGVMKSAGGIAKSIKAGSKIAMAGRNFVDAESWSVHVMFEDLTEAGIELKKKLIRQLAKDFSGNEIENSIPKIIRANPFGPVNNMVGPQGERWVPIHALVPPSRTSEAYNLTESVFAKHKAAVEKNNIGIGYLVATVSSNVFVLEPVFFWPEELNELHEFAVEPAHFKKLPGFPANPEASATIAAIRNDLITEYSAAGFIHMQLGKTYQFKEGIPSINFELINQVKQHLDPQRRMNPGCIGL